jgi:hypothetical protein
MKCHCREYCVGSGLVQVRREDKILYWLEPLTNVFEDRKAEGWYLGHPIATAKPERQDEAWKWLSGSGKQIGGLKQGELLCDGHCVLHASPRRHLKEQRCCSQSTKFRTAFQDLRADAVGKGKGDRPDRKPMPTRSRVEMIGIRRFSNPVPSNKEWSLRAIEIWIRGIRSLTTQEPACREVSR